MKRIIPFVFIILTLPVVVRGFQWPLHESVLLTTFGDKASGQFSSGVCIGLSEHPVRPILDGEMIYYFDEEECSFGIPTGLGNHVVLQHEGGLRSVYAHLETGSIPGNNSTMSVSDTLGFPGISGASQFENVCLFVVDMEYGQLVNPLLLLPHREDPSSPVIQAVYFEMEENLLDITGGGLVKSGKREVIVQVFDPGGMLGHLNPMTPFEIRAYVNGEEKSFLLFEGTRVQDSSIVLINSRNQSFQDVHRGDQRYSLGMVDLKPGESRLEISSRDFIGNETSLMISLTVTD